MIRTKKGQIMLLDVLFAIVIIILMFFLLLRFAEAEVYKTNVDSRTERLTSVGSLAYQKLLNNPKINCKVTDNQNTFYVPGTIKTGTITKADLGIPSDYNCSVTGITVTGCSGAPGTHEHYSVFFSARSCGAGGTLTKNEYIDYITNTSNPTTTNITLTIWRG